MITIDIDLLKRLDDESELKYLWRIDGYIREGKFQNWKEVTPLVNKELYDDETDYCEESAFRKKCKYARDFFEAGVFDTYREDAYFKELEVQKREIAKERQKLYSTKVEYTRNIRHQSRFELFYENIKDAITTLPLPEFHADTVNTSAKNEKEHLLAISDIHYGANFKSENNFYSTNEAEYRFNKLLKKTIDYVNEHNVNKMNVLTLSDDIQGILRITDLQLNETTVVQAVVEVSRLIATFLNELSAYCKIEYYHTPTSNHSQTRPLCTKASELGDEDVEYIIGNYIKDMLALNKRINVHLNFGKNYIKIPIFNFNSIALHGHTVKNIDTALSDLSMLHRTFYDFCFVGHYHSSKEIISNEACINDTEVLVCPSFIGSDPYSDSLMKGSKAACKIYVFDKYEGHTETYKLQLN